MFKRATHATPEDSIFYELKCDFVWYMGHSQPHTAPPNGVYRKSLLLFFLVFIWSEGRSQNYSDKEPATLSTSGAPLCPNQLPAHSRLVV